MKERNIHLGVVLTSLDFFLIVEGNIRTEHATQQQTNMIEILRIKLYNKKCTRKLLNVLKQDTSRLPNIRRSGVFAAECR